MIKVVLMDIGNVLVDFDIKKLLSGVLPQLDKPQHEVFKYLFTTGIGEKYEKGLITTEELVAAVRKDLAYQGTPEDFGDAWNAIFSENAGGVAALKSLKKTCRIVLASNTNDLHFTFLEKTYPFIGLADAAVLSHRVHARKPEPAFYAACVAAAGVAPEEAVLIDDMAENIQGARAAGLQAVQFSGLDALRESLKGLGLEI